MSSIPNFAGKARPPPPRTNTYTSLFFHLSILSGFSPLAYYNTGFSCSTRRKRVTCVTHSTLGSLALTAGPFFIISNRSIGHYGNRTFLFFFHLDITTHCLILLLPYCLFHYVSFFIKSKAPVKRGLYQVYRSSLNRFAISKSTSAPSLSPVDCFAIAR